MRLNQVGTLFGFAVFWVSAQFLAALGGPAAALFAALLIGVGGSFAARFFSVLDHPAWLLPVLLGCNSLLGLGITFLERPFPAFEWLAVPLCMAVSGAFVWIQTMSRRRCGLCNRRLGPGALAFNCPRCGLVVCDENCWSFEHRRCQLCVEHRVPLLSAQKQWWDRALGPSAIQGRCQVCLASFQQSDLRPCGRCRRPQCRDCWDNLNGECARCGWTVPGLPESLNLIAAPYGNALTSQHHE